MALEWVSEPGRRSRWKRWLVAAVIAAVLGVGAAVWSMVHSRPEGNPALVRVQVRASITLDQLVVALRDEGLAPHPSVLYWVLKLDGTLDGVKAGIYELPGDASASELCALLRASPKFDGVALTLRPGLTVWEVAREAARLGLGTERQIRRLAADYDFAKRHVGRRLLGGARLARPDRFAPTYLEGFLAPDTFYVRPDTSAERVLVRLIDQFQKTWRPLARKFKADRLALKKRYGVTDREIIILASLIEREVADRSESARVAGVFYNRLAKDMKLQTDPTLVYRPDRVGLKPTPAHRKDATNPYNTYAHRGLPPGPICSPSRASLIAALRPERHDYLFFVAVGGGRHAFSRSYDAHKRKVEHHLRR